MPDFRMASMICQELLRGLAWTIPAANPAMRGAENEVPLDVAIVPLVVPTTVPSPIEETSGFILLSKLGPNELKLAFKPDLSTAPTAKIESASAGAETYFQEF